MRDHQCFTNSVSESHPRVLEVHHFRYPRIRGGVDRVVAELVEAIEPECRILFEVGQWGERRLQRRHEGNLIVYRKHLVLPWTVRGFPRRLYTKVRALTDLWHLWRLIRKERIDIVHLHTLQDYHIYFKILGRLGVCPYVITLHRAETLEFPNRPQAQKDRWREILDGASEVTAVSTTLAETARTNLPLTTVPRVVRNGISDPVPGGIQVRGHSSRGRPYAVCIGALERYKGHDVAIDAWGVLSRIHKFNIELLIVGDGSLREELEARIARRGCRNRVRLLGAIPHREVLDLVAGATLCVMPSRSEGLSIALLEAAALARPIIASDIPVFREVIDDGRNGVLFPVDDARVLATKLCKLLDDDMKLQAMGNSARERFLAALGRDRMKEAYQDIFEVTSKVKLKTPASEVAS